MSKKKAKGEYPDGREKWANADEAQCVKWHYQNRIKAAGIREESDEFIEALEVELKGKLKALKKK